MKSSAWYQKLWERKLNERQLMDDPDQSWLAMRNLLDKQMPIDSALNDSRNDEVPAKTIAAKIVSLLTYILPVAAMIFCATYFIVNDRPKDVVKRTVKNKVSKRSKLVIDALKVENSTLQPSHKGNNIQYRSVILPSSIIRQPSQSAARIPFTALAKGPNMAAMLVGEIKDLPSFQDSFVPTQYLLDNQHFGSSRLIQVSESAGAERNRKKRKVVSIKATKLKKVKSKGSRSNTELSLPSYSYGINLGGNLQQNQTMYFGVFAGKKVSKRLTANLALQIHTPRSFSGTYTRASYFRPDSNPSFTFKDFRKVLVLEIPITLNYHITKKLKVIGGPVISLPIKQSGIKLGTIALPRDTLYNGKKVVDIIANTKPNKVNLGFKAGAGIQLNALGIELNYQMLTPYTFKNSLGTNKSFYNTVQVGITYRFNKKQ